MSSSGQPTSSTSNIQLIIDAIADYAKITGIDLSINLIAATLEEPNSFEAILQLFQEREKAFNEYRDGNPRLITCLSPLVKVLQALSGIVGGAIVVPIPPANALFAGIDVLLAAASELTSNYDGVLELFECLGNFIEHLEICTAITPTPIMTDIIFKVMAELLLVFALATKQAKQGQFIRKEVIAGEGDRRRAPDTGSIDTVRGSDDRRTDLGCRTRSCGSNQSSYGRWQGING